MVTFWGNYEGISQYSASAKEPWILATNLPVEIRTPKQLVTQRRQRSHGF
ncbi:hypothetical protein O5542_23815 [Escherichia coli]|nr:hypothetical protein [Escherichia coli]